VGKFLILHNNIIKKNRNDDK
jgi:hypothetical protein